MCQHNPQRAAVGTLLLDKMMGPKPGFVGKSLKLTMSFCISPVHPLTAFPWYPHKFSFLLQQSCAPSYSFSLVSTQILLPPNQCWYPHLFPSVSQPLENVGSQAFQGGLTPFPHCSYGISEGSSYIWRLIYVSCIYV